MEKMKDLRNKSADDCEKQLQEIRLSLLKEYAQVAQGTTLKSPGKIRAMKRTYARIMTALHEKQDQKVQNKKTQNVSTKNISKKNDNLSKDRGR